MTKNLMEGLGTVNKHVAQNWFRDYICFEDKTKSVKPSVVKDETSFEIVKQQLSTSTRTL